jgi:hypothetical protein
MCTSKLRNMPSAGTAAGPSVSIHADVRSTRLNVPPSRTAAGLAATAAGGRRHMSPGRPCRHREVVHFLAIFSGYELRCDFVS